MRITLPAALLLVAAPLSAQGYVGGFVLDSATKAPIPCVIVALLDTTGHAVARQVTIDNGAFQFDAPPHGTYRLGFALWDFETLFAASEELDSTSEHARTYALNFRMVADTARRPSRAQYADSASDAPPKPIIGRQSFPELPGALRRKGPRAFSAIFDVRVDSTGSPVPSSVKVTSSTDPAYGELIEKFLRKVKYKPARLDHHPVCAWIRGEEIKTEIYEQRFSSSAVMSGEVNGRMRRGVWRTLPMLVTLIASVARAQRTPPNTYANPIDIDYRYNYEQQNEGISYRSGADPVIVIQRGRYYLFETLGDGYWESRDLGTWRHITPTRWPLNDLVAPSALSVRDTIYLMPSTTRPVPIMMLTEPATGVVGFYNRVMPGLPNARELEAATLAKPDSVQPGPWDAQFFHDPDTERWFLYWNSSNAYPLHAIELDKTKHLAYEGTPKWLFGLNPTLHGWERFGRDHRDTTIAPFIEGAWMTKHGGRYYLQYGAPGTEYNVYATGTWVGDDPLGPFTYAPYNPIAYKPGGFVTGAGHGNTFQDVHGNWWNTGTPWIGVNWNFERRIGLHPAAFDADGQLHVDTRFGDFPHWLPTKRVRSSDELFSGWMLLSYGKPATASSQLDSFPPSRVTDENPRTFWVARANRPGEWLTVDLGRAMELRAIQVNYADYKSGLFGTDSTVVTRFRLRTSMDGRSWRTVADLSRETRDRPNAYVELASPTRARYVRYDHVHVGAQHLAISDIRVFGNGAGAKPAAPSAVTAKRDRDERNALITWQPVAGAVGYNVRWGIAPTKLYETYQRFADQPPSLDLRALDVGQAYWVAVESFDENGVSALTPVVPIR